jgi:hypothetical protein
MRKSRQGVDAILPGGYASAQWSDEEMVDLTNEAYTGLQREFRLVHKKWGLTTLNTSSAAFTREGETYDPSTALVHDASTQKLTLPPDFAELVRITCTNNRSLRFFPASEEMDHWIDLEQSGFIDNTLTIASAPAGLVFYYDILDNRTLFLIPPTSGSFNLEIDYIPMKRILYYTRNGTVTVTNASATISGTATTFITDGIYSEAAGQGAELIAGISDPQSNAVSVAKDYPRVSSITSDTAATLKAVWPGTTLTTVPFILAMSPTLPREYHAHLCRVTSSLMLSKVNPDIAEKYFQKFMTQFKEQINPVIRRRQSQQSPVVEDAEEFGMGDY